MKCTRCIYVMIFVALVVLALGFFALVDAAGPGDTTLSWTDNATNELGFDLQRHEGVCGQGGTFASLPGNIPANATSTKDTTTVAGKSYCYRIRAYNNSQLDGSGSVQFSDWSNEAGVTYGLPFPTAAPSGLTVQ